MKYLIGALRHPRDYDWRHLRPWQMHSRILAVAGTVYILLGLTWNITADANEAVRPPVLDFASMRVWGAVWVLGGALGLISARWPPASKTWGYTVLASLAWAWAAAYFMSVLSDAPLFRLSGTLVWSLVGMVWWFTAGLVNPDDAVLAAVIEEFAPDDRAA